jgi:hypothetical protein
MLSVFRTGVASLVLLLGVSCAQPTNPAVLSRSSFGMGAPMGYPSPIFSLAGATCDKCDASEFCAGFAGGASCAKTCTQDEILQSQKGMAAGQDCHGGRCCVQAIDLEAGSLGVVRYGVVDYVDCGSLSSDKCTLVKDPSGNPYCQTVSLGDAYCYNHLPNGMVHCGSLTTSDSCNASSECNWNDNISCTDAKDPLCGQPNYASEVACKNVTGCYWVTYAGTLGSIGACNRRGVGPMGGHGF